MNLGFLRAKNYLLRGQQTCQVCGCPQNEVAFWVSMRASLVIPLERACAALASLVRSEYGERYTLDEIAELWGEGITPDEVAALRVLEDGSLRESFDEFLHHARQSGAINMSKIGD